MLKKCLIATVLAVAITATIAHPASAATAPARTASAPPSVVVPAQDRVDSKLATSSLQVDDNSVRVVSDGTVIYQAKKTTIDFFKVAKCTGAIIFVALTTAFVAGKALKIRSAVAAARKWVNEVGGAKEAARLIISAHNEAERNKVLLRAREIAGASILDFFGITQIRESCF